MIENILSVDVEEWFHPEALQHRFPAESWLSQQKRVERNTNILLDLFAAKKVKGTFFTLGWVAEHYPQLIRRIVAEGHELGSHGYSHQMVTRLDRESFREDLQRSIEILEDVSGEKVLGFRAPTFSVVKQTFWAWEVMLELGLQYDSSVYPIWHDRYGVPDAPRSRYVAVQNGERKLWEFPMSTVKIRGKNMPFGGGGYLRIFPNWLTIRGIKSVNNEGIPAVLYTHPWEFDTEQPRVDMGFVQSIRHYYNIDNNLKKLAELLDMFSWTCFRDVLKKM